MPLHGIRVDFSYSDELPEAVEGGGLKWNYDLKLPAG